jgi:hypothetical protein
MALIRPARILYQIHTQRISILARQDIEAVLRRHPVLTAAFDVLSIDCANQVDLAQAHTPSMREFLPSLSFEDFAAIKRAKWIHRVDVAEVEPEDLEYVRSALLVAGELAAMTEGTIIDLLAYRTMNAEDVLHQMERPFDLLEHISVHVETGSKPFWVHTHGMEKFAHADFEVHGVPRQSIGVAVELLRHLVTAVVSGGGFEPGESAQLCGFKFEFRPQGEETHDHYSVDALCLQQFSLVTGTASEAMEGMLVLSDL